jgi:hypothetical protein
VSVTSAFETGVSTGGSRGSGQRKWMSGQGERAHAWLGGDWRRGTRRGCRQTSVPQRQIRLTVRDSWLESKMGICLFVGTEAEMQARSETLKPNGY